MVLSHPHPDHYQGLRFVAAHFPVSQFWYSYLARLDPDLRSLVKTLADKKTAFLSPRRLATGRYINGVEIQVLHPAADFTGSSTTPTDKELNNLSLVIRLRYKDVSFLFPGDMEKETEDELMRRAHLEPVDVLLVPHHGSRTSSSIALLQQLKPKIAIFSVGFENRFHLPATQICRRYAALGIRTYRTDVDGAITVTTDGREIAVATFLNLPKVWPSYEERGK